MNFKNTDKLKSFFIQFIAALFIFLFGYTGLKKLQHPGIFQSSLNKSPLISNYAVLISWSVPVLELIVVCLLFFPKTRRLGLYSSLALMSVFTLYIAYMIAFAKDLPCSCGGVLEEMNWNQHLIFNIVAWGLAIVGILLSRKNRKKKVQHEVYEVVFT